MNSQIYEYLLLIKKPKACNAKKKASSANSTGLTGCQQVQVGWLLHNVHPSKLLILLMHKQSSHIRG